MKNFFRGFFWNGEKKPLLPSRLTEIEVRSIASNVLPEPLLAPDQIQTENGLIWEVSTATIGSMKTVRIRDADGKVLEILSSGLR